MERGGEPRRARLRRDRRVADLRLDGRRQGGARVGLAVPGARPRAAAGSASTSCRPGRWGRSRRAGSPGSSSSPTLWRAQAPLGWDIEDPAPVPSTICFLLSDYARAISGEIVHVDGGFHAVGAPTRSVRSGLDSGRPLLWSGSMERWLASERNVRICALLGAIAIAFSSILVRLSHASPSTAAIFRCAYALPVLGAAGVARGPAARAAAPGRDRRRRGRRRACSSPPT